MLLAARTVTSQMVPGARQLVSSRVTILSVCAALVAAIVLLFPYKQDANFVVAGIHCWTIGTLSAAGVGGLSLLVLRRGAWLAPADLGGASGFFAGLGGLAALEICCPNLDRGHIGIWHVGVALTAMLIGGALGALSGARRGRVFD